MRIDDKKIVPLALGGGIWGALAGGVIGSGEKTGGFFGITEGKYAFQHSEISVGMQALALVVTIGIALVSGLILIFALEKTIGLRVSEEDEIRGLDALYWNAEPPPYDDITGRETDERQVATHRGGRHQSADAVDPTRSPESVS
jgi:ammonia channel protein AmtB